MSEYLNPDGTIKAGTRPRDLLDRAENLEHDLEEIRPPNVPAWVYFRCRRCSRAIRFEFDEQGVPSAIAFVAMMSSSVREGDDEQHVMERLDAMFHTITQRKSAGKGRIVDVWCEGGTP